MQPVDATNATRSVSATRETVINDKKASAKIEIEPIPIIEPLPHYPLSANVMEMLAYIEELIETQKETTREALREKQIAEAREEMDRLLDAALTEVENDTSGDSISALKGEEKVANVAETAIKSIDDALKSQGAGQENQTSEVSSLKIADTLHNDAIYQADNTNITGNEINNNKSNTSNDVTPSLDSTKSFALE